mmetsp:Transcript_20684/g.43524  ORF Transcript_20684/g.43524 Transcript_20684/m.43524 type:complete len:161 (+) Transcript_20684:705-1187(+)
MLICLEGLSGKLEKVFQSEEEASLEVLAKALLLAFSFSFSGRSQKEDAPMGGNAVNGDDGASFSAEEPPDSSSLAAAAAYLPVSDVDVADADGIFWFPVAGDTKANEPLSLADKIARRRACIIFELMVPCIGRYDRPRGGQRSVYFVFVMRRFQFEIVFV